MVAMDVSPLRHEKVATALLCLQEDDEARCQPEGNLTQPDGPHERKELGGTPIRRRFR